MARCVALLRGINVGGKHPIRMTDLKACFEAQGLRDTQPRPRIIDAISKAVH